MRILMITKQQEDRARKELKYVSEFKCEHPRYGILNNCGKLGLPTCNSCYARNLAQELLQRLER